jgi:hypothetical protein
MPSIFYRYKLNLNKGKQDGIFLLFCCSRSFNLFFLSFLLTVVFVFQQMLVFTPNLRVCAADALEHPYFRNSGYSPPAMQQLGGSAALSSSGPLSPASAALFLNAPTSDDSGQSADSQPDQ